MHNPVAVRLLHFLLVVLWNRASKAISLAVFKILGPEHNGVMTKDYYYLWS